MHLLPPLAVPPARARASGAPTMDVVETRLWLNEHDWLFSLLRSAQNAAPTFRMPDLVSACVAIVFSHNDAPDRIFGFMGTQLLVRDHTQPRRRSYIWRPQFEMLRGLQCSPQNQHPNPSFQLDQFTSACAALCQLDDASGTGVLRQARHNTAHRLLARNCQPPPGPIRQSPAA